MIPLSNIYLFIAGDNNLDVAARNDITKELLTLKTSSNVRTFVQFDRRAPMPWETNDTTFETQRFLVQNGQKKLIKSLGETNTGNPNVLRRFLMESMQLKKAQHHMVIIWGHGGGLQQQTSFKDIGYKWVGVDESAKDALNITELSKAFNKLPYKPAIIAFDACLMAVLEIAYSLRNKAKFMIASQAIEPPNGWSYDKIIPLFDTEYFQPNESFVNQVILEYFQSYLNTNELVTLSGINLSKVERVVKLRDALAKLLIAKLPIYRDIYWNIANNVQRFKDKHYIDLKHFVLLCIQKIEDAQIKEVSYHLFAAITELIIGNYVTGSYYVHAHGISTLFPLALEAKLPTHLELHEDYPYWIQFIQQLFLTQKKQKS